jgi:hypothetical protein
MGTIADALKIYLKPLPATDRYKIAGEVEQLCRTLEAEDHMEAELAVEGRPKPTMAIGQHCYPGGGTTLCIIVGFKWHHARGTCAGAWGYRLLSQDCGYMPGHYFDGDYPYYGAQQLRRLTAGIASDHS